jgi:hypothetical protein
VGGDLVSEAGRELIREWHDRMTALDEAMDAFSGLVGTSPESRLPGAVWRVAERYTDAVAIATDAGGWLEWWWLECHLGTRPMHADDRLIRTIDDLIAEIERDE